MAAAVKALAPLLLPYTLPPVKVKTDFSMKTPSGEAASGLSWDDSPYVRIDLDTELVDELALLAVLLHELAHAVASPEIGHNGLYRTVWRHAGFVGLPTGSDPSRELWRQLDKIAAKLGPYPGP